VSPRFWDGWIQRALEGFDMFEVMATAGSSDANCE
jgi:hypothetical protein